jgi:TolB protein
MKILRIIGIFWLFLWQGSASAALTIEITQGAEGAMPVAVVPFGWEGAGQPPAEDVAAIIAADLQRSGRFRLLPEADMLSRPHSVAQVDFREWQLLGRDALLVGSMKANGPGGYLIQFQLFDVLRGEQLAGFSVPTTDRGLRLTAHQIADIVYEKLIGVPGAFATRIAYITEEKQDGGTKVYLRIADADGFNPQTIVSSPEPLMSPAWSPDGNRIAYVSFEKRRHAIYVQEVVTGRRDKLASFDGINGSPAWSPDGRRLAMTLSKDGNPEIYVMDLASRRLTRLTQSSAIDTEPAWSPDGQHIVFTSDRGGAPQIYRVSAAGGSVQRVTFENDYNARASYSPDGKSLALVTRSKGQFRIGLLDLERNLLQVLTRGSLDESPSFAPNGSMILYATKQGRRGVLSAVSADGGVRQRLVVDVGDVREPAWSPKRKR